MSNDIVCFMVRLSIKPEHADAVAAGIAGAVDPTRREPGNIVFEAARSAVDPNVIVLYEVWASNEDYQRHNERPEMKERMAMYGAVLAGPPEITPLARM